MQIRTALDLGLVIRERRRKLELGQHTLAEQVAVSRQWIVAVEKGRPRAELGLVLRTLDALGLRLSVEPAEATAQDRAIGIPNIDIDAVVDGARGRRR